MVHRYPAAVKAFYMEPDPERPELALCVDVLAPEGYGEIIGGSQRMASYDLLLKRIHRARTAGRGVQVVSRFAQVWRRSARGIRHGHRARGGVDLRTGACARDHSVSAHAAPAVSVSSGQARNSWGGTLSAAFAPTHDESSLRAPSFGARNLCFASCREIRSLATLVMQFRFY